MSSSHESTQATSELRDGEEEARILFEHAPIGVCRVALDGRFLSVNPALCRMLGYTEGELRRLRVAEVTHPDDVELTGGWMRRLVEDPAAGAAFEKRYVHKDGRAVWGAVSAQLLRDSEGRPRFFITHVQEITGRRQAHDLLRENEEKFRAAFENAPMGMTLVRPDGRFLAVNPVMCQMLGYTLDELLPSTFNDVTHPDDIEPGNRWVRRMISGDLSQPEFEKRYIHKDGHFVWGLVRAHWLRNPDGSVRMAVTHILDITERKRAEEALRESERHLREAHEIAQMGHWRLDLASGAMQWGEGVFRLLARDPARTTPSYAAFTSQVHPDDRAGLDVSYREALERGAPCDAVFRLLMPDGRVKHLRRISRTERDASGRPAVVTGVLQDVTVIREAEEERIRLEAQLHRAQKMEAVGYLAGGIAHDFNNLLTTIGGNASLALLDAQGKEELVRSLAEITKAVSAAGDLTRRLLTFSRRQVIAPKVVNLNDVVQHFSGMLQRLLGEDLELVVVPDPHLGQVRIDPGQAEQILVNLAVNARDAMSDGGTLTIETANVVLDDDYCRTHGNIAAGEYVMLAVTDDGAGMSEEVRAHAFEPFFTTKDPGKGTGLGLAVVYGAVRQNQGHIDVYTEVGQGTTFKVFLPRVDEPAQDLRPAPAPARVQGHETVVLVEDDARVRSLALRVLVRNGYRVHAYPNGEEALGALRTMEEPVHLIVTDVVMPGMNGRVFSEKVRAMRPEVRVLFTSGYTRNVIVHHGVLDEGIEFLPKPYSVDDLAARVREVLDQAEAR